nr:hypothetical protein [Streptomyces sp. SID4950]
MVTETWEQAKLRLLRIFSRDGGTAALDGELERSRATLVAAVGAPDQADLTSDVTAGLRLLLRRLLEQQPDAAAELRALVEECAPEQDTAPIGSVHNSITGGTVHGAVVQGHTFSGLTFDTRGDTAEERRNGTSERPSS